MTSAPTPTTRRVTCAIVPLRKDARNSNDYSAQTAAQQKKAYPDIAPALLDVPPAAGVATGRARRARDGLGHRRRRAGRPAHRSDRYHAVVRLQGRHRHSRDRERQRQPRGCALAVAHRRRRCRAPMRSGYGRSCGSSPRGSDRTVAASNRAGVFGSSASVTTWKAIRRPPSVTAIPSTLSGGVNRHSARNASSPPMTPMAEPAQGPSSYALSVFSATAVKANPPSRIAAPSVNPRGIPSIEPSL